MSIYMNDSKIIQNPGGGIAGSEDCCCGLILCAEFENVTMCGQCCPNEFIFQSSKLGSLVVNGIYCTPYDPANDGNWVGFSDEGTSWELLHYPSNDCSGASFGSTSHNLGLRVKINSSTGKLLEVEVVADSPPPTVPPAGDVFRWTGSVDLDTPVNNELTTCECDNETPDPFAINGTVRVWLSGALP